MASARYPARRLVTPRGSRLRALATRVAIGGAGLYALLVMGVALGYRAALFPAPKTGLEPIARGARVVTREIDGIPVVTFEAAAPPGKPVIVYFHGNGEELVDLSSLALALLGEGVGFMLVEYPGYGLAARGTPTEETLYRAAAHALDQLRASGVRDGDVVLVGHSLGSGVAAEMAVRGYGAKLVLISPFTSMVDMVSRFAPIVPSSWLVRDRFETLAKAPQIRQPTVVVHGDRDTLIPMRMGQAVASAVPSARLEIFEQAGHNDLFQRDGDRLLALIVAHPSTTVGPQKTQP